MRELAEYIKAVKDSEHIHHGSNRMLSDAEYKQLQELTKAGYASIISYKMCNDYGEYPHSVNFDITSEGMEFLLSFAEL